LVGSNVVERLCSFFATKCVAVDGNVYSYNILAFEALRTIVDFVYQGKF